MPDIISDMALCSEMSGPQLSWGGTLNSHRAASPLVWLVEGVERWELPDHLQVSSSKLGWKQAKFYCHLYGAQR
ncbi:hypothetical protein TNCV_3512071 [Trichonephila clavipes]|nr:hypothetical protein TNCV_3512071 [Trichonephila clavipes]